MTHAKSHTLAVLGGLVSAILAGLLMAQLRASLQVRSLPERLLDGLLLLVPPAQMEAGLQRFGFDAKAYALQAVTLVSLAVLATLGATVLARGWTGWRLIALGLGLWLVVMLVVTPLSGAGVFATLLVEGSLTTSAGYLAPWFRMPQYGDLLPRSLYETLSPRGKQLCRFLVEL